MVSTDSCCAASMKLQVFTTSTSASSARGVSSYPLRARIPIMTSLSTRFLGHPRLMNPTFGMIIMWVKNAILAHQECQFCAPPKHGIQRPAAHRFRVRQILTGPEPAELDSKIDREARRERTFTRPLLILLPLILALFALRKAP